MRLREATTINEIVDRLVEKYSDRGWNFAAFRAPNYDVSKVDIESVREAAQAFDDMLTKHPYIQFTGDSPLKAIHDPYRTGPQKSNGFAVNPTHTLYDDGTKNYTHPHNYVSMNEPIATTQGRNKYHAVFASGQRGSETRDYNLDAMNRPTYYTMVHEMGHVLDGSGRGRAQDRILAQFKDLYLESDEADALFESFADKVDDFEQAQRAYDRYVNAHMGTLLISWLEDKLVSDYSYNGSDRTKGVYITEAIAEAVLDVEIRGDKANEFSKWIYEIVIDEAKKGATP